MLELDEEVDSVDVVRVGLVDPLEPSTTDGKVEYVEVDVNDLCDDWYDQYRRGPMGRDADLEVPDKVRGGRVGVCKHGG